MEKKQGAIEWATSIGIKSTLVSLGRNVLAGELLAEVLDLVKVVDLDALFGTPGAEDLGGRGCTGDGDSIVERIHADDGLQLWQLVGILKHRRDMVGYIINPLK